MSTIANTTNNLYQIPVLQFSNQYISGSVNKVSDPTKCVFHTYESIGKLAGSVNVPDGGLSITHGTVSDNVSNPVRDSTKNRKD